MVKKFVYYVTYLLIYMVANLAFNVNFICFLINSNNTNGFSVPMLVGGVECKR